jgi:uncharacterized protein
VKLNVHDVEESAKLLLFDEPTEGLNDLLVHGEVHDFDFPATVAVRLEYYRAGQELFFQGHIGGDVTGHCGRCLEDYAFALDTDFHVVLVPKSEEPTPEAELTDDELDLSVYDGDQIDLAPLLREQIILALPTRPLCDDRCKGLCSRCGVNLNVESCRCAAAAGDSRLAVLRNLKIGH